nr:hypothetical protein [Tanacetum cinerariifolium]
MVNRTNVDYAALLWWDFNNCVLQKKDVIQYPCFTKLINANLMKKYTFVSSRLEEDYHFIKSTPRAHRTPTLTAANPQGKKRKQSTEETSSPRISLKLLKHKKMLLKYKRSWRRKRLKRWLKVKTDDVAEEKDNDDHIDHTLVETHATGKIRKVPDHYNNVVPNDEKKTGMKKKKRAEVIHKVFIKEDIVIDEMHMNLVPPTRVVGSHGLVNTKPEAGIFVYNESFDLFI